ncbi:MAG TPA: sulfatase-like hydrolase/transferase [Planctomycetota bacterium]
MPLLPLLTLLVASLTPTSPPQEPRGERPNVVLIVWNDPTLERLGFLAPGPKAVTPTLDGLLADGALFPGGTLTCPRGRPTAATVLTGRDAQQTGVFGKTAPQNLPPAETLGVLFRAQGYRTLFVGRFREGRFEDHGFEAEVRSLIEDGPAPVEAFVAEHAGRAPLFLWWGPEVPEGYGAKNLDRALAPLVAALEARGERERTLFAFVLNGELRGLEFTARDCAAGNLHAPLALAGAAALPGGRVPAGTHAERAAPHDLYPTLLELAGLAPPARAPARSLVPLLRGETLPPRAHGASFYAYAPTGSRAALQLERNLQALVWLEERWKYVLFLEDVGIKIDRVSELVTIERSAGEQLLFDLATDPGESVNLAPDPEQAERLDALRAALLAWWSASGGPELRLPFLPPPLGPPPSTPRPNLVLVVADDMDYEHLGFLGNPRVRTPTLDELARTGVVFPVAHVPMSRCRPSLAALLSGRWPLQNGIYDNDTAHTLSARDSLPNLLKAAGYATFQGGKFWEGSPATMGFLAPEKIDAIFQRFVRESQDELFAFIDRHHAERPLFLWWAPMLPHGPFDPPERHREPFRATEVPVPEWIPESQRAAFVEAERTAYAMGAWLDEGLAALRAKLAACGELEDTLFVFLIDNGFANGFPSKGTVYEKGLRTPVVVSWPKTIAGGRTRDELVSTLDLYRTLLDYAGVPAPAEAAGASLAPLLAGGTYEARAALHGAVFDFRPGARQQKAEDCVYALYTRTTRWKAVHYLRDLAEGEILLYHEFAPFPAARRGQRALYDLSVDPHERHDLGGDPAHAELLEELLAGAEAWWRETGGAELELAPDRGDTADPARKKPARKKR